MRAGLESRVTRKLLRNRPALFALAVIMVYALVAATIGVGLVTLKDTEARVGPDNLPGCFLPPTPERRVDASRKLLDRVAAALRRGDPQAALEDIRFLRVADQPPRQLQQTIDRAVRLYDELAVSDNLDADPAMLPRIVEFERTVQQLQAPLAARERTLRNVVLLLGTDQLGRSILLRAIYSVNVAVVIGLVTSLLSVTTGSVLGAAAGYFGGWVDHLVIWLYSTLSSIPYLVLLVLLAYMFTGSRFEESLVPVFAAFGLTFWIGPCRVIRGETLKIKQLEYIQAATTVGFPRLYLLARHVLPNTAHLILINFSLLFIAAIKSEVILSFLGLGVKRGPSWGIMISQSKDEVLNGFFWQIGAATAFMFVLVLAFNILTDALQDVFDPKHL